MPASKSLHFQKLRVGIGKMVKFDRGFDEIEGLLIFEAKKEFYKNRKIVHNRDLVQPNKTTFSKNNKRTEKEFQYNVHGHAYRYLYIHATSQNITIAK